MDKEKEFEYSCENNDEVNMVKEEALVYGVKQQGEYTLEDYYANPDERRVELIDGVIYDMPTPSLLHQMVLGEIIFELGEFKKQNKDNFMFVVHRVGVQLDCDDKTMLEPDGIVVCDKDKIKQYIYGAPDFVVEVISSFTEKKDSIIKLRKYKEAGVREYWMVDPDKKKVVVYDWSKSEIPTVYGFDAKVPVGIFGGECEIDFEEINREIAFLYEEEKD